MPIAEQVLQQAGARLETFAANQVIFAEGHPAANYYQLASGMVKMVNAGENADFIQGIFFAGESFGEPPLFGDFPYPASAISMRNGRVWVLPKSNFIHLLQREPVHHFALTRTISLRLQSKANALRDIKHVHADAHIMALLHQLARRLKGLPEGVSGAEVSSLGVHIPFTRQELADMLGLRVETVIRSLSELAKRGEVVIAERQLYLPQRAVVV